VESENCAMARPKFDDSRLFGMLSFRNGLEYCNFNFSLLIGNLLCAFCRNFVRFSLVTLELEA